MAQPSYSSSVGYIGEQFITLSFDVDLDAANPPPTNAFDIQINGTGTSVTLVTVDAATKTVILTLSAGSFLPGDIIDFTYSDPTGGNDANAIQGSDGTDAASFSNSLVVATGRPGPSAPPAPAVSSGSDSGALGDGITNVTTPTITGTADANNTVNLYDTDGTTPLGTTTADGAGNWSITSSVLSAGSHTLKVSQTDGGSNVSPLSAGLAVTIDTSAAAPTALALAGGSDSGAAGDGITNDATPTVTGHAEANAAVRLYDTDGTTLLGSTTADGAGNWSITSSALSAGGHTLTVKQTDAAGNVSAASGGLAATIDTAAAAPAAPTLAGASDSGAPGDGVTNHATPTITGTAEANATVRLYDTDGTTVLGTATANGSGAWSIVASTLSNGAHTLSVKQTDPAGNVSAASATLALTIDTEAPQAPGVPALAAASDSGTVGDNTTNVAAPTITGTAAANATVKLYDTDGTTLLGTATADGAGNWSIVSSTLSLGVHTLTARQTDLAGNTSPAGESLALTIQAPPVPSEPPATVVDGVPVTQQPVALPGGGSGTQTTIPIVSDTRSDSSGSAGVADIPLVASGANNLLLAQVAPGFGLTSTGGPSQPAGTSLDHLIQSILAATPSHPASDQGHLTGNGVTFLAQLAASVPLLVQTIVPASGATAPAGALTLTGTSSASQHTALVIDASHLPGGSQLVLNSVDFAAIIGAADVTGNTRGQILTGDAAGQHFTVTSGAGGAVFSGGGGDTLTFTSPQPSAGGARQALAAATSPDTTILHGGQGSDTVSFSGAASSYDVVAHEGYLVVSAKAQPSQHALVLNAEFLKFSDTTTAVENDGWLTAIAGLYKDVLGRQADYLGIEYWADLAKSGTSLGAIALSIITSAESQGLHPMQFNGDSAHDIELLYQGIFSRHSDADGLAFWTDQMAHGRTLEQVAQSFLTADEMAAHKIGVQDWDFHV